jgi:putative flippase GtrA
MKRFLNHPTVRTHGPQLLKFGLTGGAGSILDLGTLTLLTRVLSVPAEVAFLLSAFVGATFVFFVNKHFTFSHRASAFLPQLLKHYTVYGPAIIANFLLSNALFLVMPDLAAKFIAIGVIAVWNYLMSHHYVFKKNPSA